LLIRVLIALENKKDIETLTNKLLHYSIENNDVDLNIAYVDDLERLYDIFDEIDISFVSYTLLSDGFHLLANIYHKNPSCLMIPVGLPDEDICRYLSVRPAGHLQGVESQCEINDLCSWCKNEIENNNEVLQISTRQGSYAITLSSICYCQSEQKYISVFTNSGKIYRKLGKLDEFSQKMPSDFLRVHQSFLINIKQAIGLDKSSWEIEMKTGEKIPVSRVYRKMTEEILKNVFSKVNYVL